MKFYVFFLLAYSPNKLITVITATYNRAHLLPDLYQSLCRQSCQSFDWLIVDDGSTDNTESLVHHWMTENTAFLIHYLRKENGGKNRAVNEGVKMIETPFTMIIDSDDFLTDDAIAFLSSVASEIIDDETIAGVAGLRGTDANTPLQRPDIPARNFILANNLERAQYHLNSDACEVYKTSLLRSHPFEVWPGEMFVPEEIVWDTFALEGLRLLWYPRVTCIVRYQKEGLTNMSFRLQQQNPMGFACLFKHRVILAKTIHQRFVWNCFLFAQCFLAHNLGYGLKNNLTWCSFLSIPLGGALAVRRIIQYKNYL